MTQFVNYNKRGYTLPPGCKDLIDVLAQLPVRQESNEATRGFPWLETVEERFPSEGLAHLGRFVSMLLQWRGELFVLSISAQELAYPVTLYHSRSEQTTAIVLVAEEITQEKAIRDFFGRRGIRLLWDYSSSAWGASDCGRGLGYWLPSEEAHAISLTTELLITAYGLSDDSGLEFRYYRKVTAT